MRVTIFYFSAPSKRFKFLMAQHTFPFDLFLYQNSPTIHFNRYIISCIFWKICDQSVWFWRFDLSFSIDTTKIKHEWACISDEFQNLRINATWWWVEKWNRWWQKTKSRVEPSHSIRSVQLFEKVSRTVILWSIWKLIGNRIYKSVCRTGGRSAKL